MEKLYMEDVNKLVIKIIDKVLETTDLTEAEEDFLFDSLQELLDEELGCGDYRNCN